MGQGIREFEISTAWILPWVFCMRAMQCAKNEKRHCMTPPKTYNAFPRSGPMRRQLDEPRQVRKEAAVIAMVVCCGVPGLFCIHLSSKTF